MILFSSGILGVTVFMVIENSIIKLVAILEIVNFLRLLIEEKIVLEQLK